MPQHRVVRTRPDVFLDVSGQAISGTVVVVELTQFGEVHEIRLETRDPAEFERKLAELIAWRTRLAAFEDEEPVD